MSNYSVSCKDAGGFEDQLTPNQTYTVLERGENDYLLEADDGKARWYGEVKFTTPV